MHIEDIRNINKMSVELLVRLYALLEQEKVKEEKELIKDFIGELDLYLKEFTQFEAEKIIEFEKREREK
jgi:translation elongation factor EF-Ts